MNEMRKLMEAVTKIGADRPRLKKVTVYKVTSEHGHSTFNENPEEAATDFAEQWADYRYSRQDDDGTKWDRDYAEGMAYAKRIINRK